MSWDHYFLEMAALAATRSKDPSSKVGAVIADEKHRIVSVGFNGLPRGVQDHANRLEDRELKLRMVIHAEVNAILFAQRDLAGCTMYVSPFMPCAQCAAMIVQVGVKKVVTPSDLPDRWSTDSGVAKTMFREAEVELYIVP